MKLIQFNGNCFGPRNKGNRFNDRWRSRALESEIAENIFLNNYDPARATRLEPLGNFGWSDKVVSINRLIVKIEVPTIDASHAFGG